MIVVGGHIYGFSNVMLLVMLCLIFLVTSDNLLHRGMSIKKNIPARQKSFLARMGGVLKEVKGQKTLSPAYWSIRAWKKDFPL